MSESGPVHLDEKLTRSHFEEMTADLLERTKVPFHNVIKDAGVKLSEIDHVVLVGGSTRMPAVSSVMRELGKSMKKIIYELAMFTLDNENNYTKEEKNNLKKQFREILDIVAVGNVV